jgi:uncharacterized protein YhaN
MRIKELYIDGFGIFYHYPIKDLPKGLTIFIGSNESGKSTLLEFLRGVIFGYHKPHGKGYLYPPLNGGTHGGTITITMESEDQSIIVERYAVKKKYPIITFQGKELSGDDFRKLLGGADRGLFKSVFAFSLDELYDFSSLRENEIEARIVSAGIAGAGTSARKVIDELESQASEILSAKRKSPSLINRLAKDLKTCKLELKEAKKKVEMYPDLIAEEEEIRNEVASLKEKENVLRQVLNRYDTLKQLWPAWNEIIDAEESLESIAPEDNTIVFVSDSPSLLLEGRLPEDKFSNLTGLMTEHDKHVEVYRSSILQLPENKARLREIQKNLKNKYEKLGSGWDEEKLSSFDTSISKEGKVRSMEKEMDESRENYKEVQRNHQNALDELEQARQTLERINKELQGKECQDESKLVEKRETLGRLRANRIELANLERDLKLQEDRLMDAEQKVQSLQSQIKSPFPKWTVHLTLGFSIVSFIVTIALVLTGNYIVGVLLFFLGAAGVISSLLLNLKGKQSREIEARLRENLSSQRADVESIKSTLNELYKKVEQLKKSIAEDAGFLELSPGDSFHIIENLIAETDHQLQELKTIKGRLEDAKTNLNEAENKGARLADDLEKNKRKNEDVERDWNNWVKQQKIGLKLTPQEVINLFREVENARELLNMNKELLGEIKETEHNIKEWEKKSKKLLGDGGFPVGDSWRGEDLIVKFSDALEKLMKRKELLNTINSHSTQMINRLGKGKEAEGLIMELAKGEIQEWELESKKIEREIKLVENQKEDTIMRLSKKKTEREDIEKFADIAGFETKIEGYQAEISVVINKWRVISLAKAMIEGTLNEFVHNRQPTVYKNASKYFESVTKKRYPEIVYDLVAKEPAVFDKHSRRKTVKELSRGTREQLYLCIRLGLASEFASKGTSLPLVMDDVLVNFDPDRAKAIAQALINYSQEKQILLFTCHPHTEKMFKKIDQQTNVIKIEK